MFDTVCRTLVKWNTIVLTLFIFAIVGFGPNISAAADAGNPLTIEVLRTSAGSLHSNATLIMGEKNAVLVDPPFTLADAHRVAAMVLDSGRNLTHVFVTHDHPDHFFSMEVLQDVFPQVTIVAHPVVAADIWASMPFKVKRWSPMLGDNGPVHPTAPTPLDTDTIMLEGHELKVLGPFQGDHVHSTALWVPSIKALLPGDIVFNKVHLWLGEHRPENVAAWLETLDTLSALTPDIIVAGHAKPGLPNDVSGLEFSRDYLTKWQELVAVATDSQDLQKKVRAAFPETIDVLDNFILPNSADVAMGEQEPWQE